MLRSRRAVRRVVPPQLMMSRIMPAYAHAGSRGRHIPAEGALLLCASDTQLSRDSATAHDAEPGDAKEKGQIAPQNGAPIGHMLTSHLP